MKSRLLALAAALAGLLVVSAPVFAHHGRAMYDDTKLVTVKGTVSSFEFTNPHARILMNVRDGQGNIEKWVAEATSPNLLVREGWNKNILKPGDQITATGHPAKTGSNLMRIEKLTLPSGRDILPLE